MHLFTLKVTVLASVKGEKKSTKYVPKIKTFILEKKYKLHRQLVIPANKQI